MSTVHIKHVYCNTDMHTEPYSLLARLARLPGAFIYYMYGTCTCACALWCMHCMEIKALNVMGQVNWVTEVTILCVSVGVCLSVCACCACVSVCMNLIPI